MGDIVIFVGSIIVLLGGVVFLYGRLFGGPYLPTLAKDLNDALDLLDLQPGQTMLELGSGDGRMLRAAAKRGVKSIGYEVNPLLVVYARVRHRKYRHLIEVRWANCWNVDWPKSDGLFVFMLEPYMTRLYKKVVQYSKGRKYRVVSNAFTFDQMKRSAENGGMHLYIFDK